MSWVRDPLRLRERDGRCAVCRATQAMSATVAAVLAGACLSSLLPVRRIGRIDPARAVVRG